MRRFHIAIAVADVDASISDYSQRLGADPERVIPGEYALWRTDTLNFSIRRLPEVESAIRHIGWEDPAAQTLSIDHDVNGLAWEHFTAEDQLLEVRSMWPDHFNDQGAGAAD
ncbi:MAG: hypothetical protein R6V11_09325 [Ectothiorhodospiraceae bacterium]